MNAVWLSRILGGVMLLLAVGIGFGFFELSGMLTSSALDASHEQTQASVVASQISQLQKLQITLAKQQDVVQRAKEIVANGKSYDYQDQIISDVNTYAKLSGVTVSGFNFPAATTTTVPKTSGAKPKGTLVQATLSLVSPLPYDNFLKFLTLVERNLTKIQITSVTLTPEGKDPSLVNNPTVGIQVYISS